MKSIFKILMKFIIFKNDSLPTYYGIGEHLLDFETLGYRMFGAVWKLHKGYRYIIGYWFGDNKDEILHQINCRKWKNIINQDDQVFNVYQSFREDQKRKLWHKRINLSNKPLFKEKWKEKEPGWYLLRSNKNFPCSISCIHKTTNSLWIEHLCICESENDVKSFINLINFEHKVHITL